MYIHVHYTTLYLIHMHTCAHICIHHAVSFLQLIYISLFCIIYTYTLYTTVYLINMHILYIGILKCITIYHIQEKPKTIYHVHIQNIFFKARSSNVKDIFGAISKVL